MLRVKGISFLDSTINVTPTGEATASFNDMRVSNATLQALAKMGISTPTPIQDQAIPAMLDGRDLIGQARTGSGKTLAFGIPAIESIDTRIRGVQVIVLTPTRELAMQVGGVLEALAAPKGVKVGLVYGGRALGPQRDMLRRGVHAVVGTPGRVLDLLNQGALWLDKVRFFVLDEADEMLDQGFAPDVERILGRTTPDRQTALFSATLPDWVRKTADKHLNQPVTVTVDPNPEDAAPVEHVAYDLLDGDKMAALKDLLDYRGEGSVIIFGRTKHGVKKLARQLVQAGYPVAALQGNLSQNARDQVMADFRSGAVPILFATNVAARGIDVSDVVAVINVELPESSELLTHRIGRTGRMGRRGIAITLLNQEDGAKWRQLEKGLGRRIPRTTWKGAAAAYDGVPDEALAAAQAPVAQPSPVRGRRSQPAPAAPVSGRRPAFGRAAASEATVHSQPRQPMRPSDRPAAAERTQRARPAVSAANGQRHQIQCSECGQPAEVRFQPDPTRPVYCDACFGNRPRRTRRPAAASAQA
jgi:ATP-dependent RNA helicase DeaD